jgi:CRISPR-associated protein Cmr1
MGGTLMSETIEGGGDRGQQARRGEMPAAPTYGSLPTIRRRASRSGPALAEISVRAELATPILGGGAQTRTVDDVEIIRAATVRGHLRFWWRALYAPEYAASDDLYQRESALWGRAATDEEGGRSDIEIRIDIEKTGEIDHSDIRLYDSKHGKATPGAYALWPARSERKTNTPPAPRRLSGTRFRLTLITSVVSTNELRNVLRAWLLFGGYGSRTRRGLGSFTVLDDASGWLPSSATRAAVETLFGADIFAPPAMSAGDVPRLGGASFHVGKPESDPIKAWTTALDWLTTFRQGTGGPPGDRAREPGKPRPSISNWPEADKIRHLKGKTSAHRPRHNATPVWPRAGFGLPIIGQFQTRARDDSRLDEPGPFELRWRAEGREHDHDRLASPLMVKALPVADGKFVPCALWLDREYPAGDVILRGAENSGAPFDRLVAPGDSPMFSALSGKQSLRTAFLDWLSATHETTVVAP